MAAADAERRQAEGGVAGAEPVEQRGGHACAGHPFGMTGARMTTTLLNGLRARDASLGLATLCVGGGQGMAVVLERLS